VARKRVNEHKGETPYLEGFHVSYLLIHGNILELHYSLLNLVSYEVISYLYMLGPYVARAWSEAEEF
jgi:hypothetical protein